MKKRTLFEILEELDAYIKTSESPRDTALLVLGYMTGVALGTGWTIADLVAVRLWPTAERK